MQTWRDWEAGKVGVRRAARDSGPRHSRCRRNAGEARACRSSPTASFGAAAGRAAFLSAVEGFDFRASKLTFRNEDGFATPSPAPVATKRIRRTRPIVTEDFKFLHAAASKRVKVTMPTPSHMHFGQFKDAVDRNVYPERRAVLGRHDHGLPPGNRRALRGRLPLSAARRGSAGAPVRPEHPRAWQNSEGDDPDQARAALHRRSQSRGRAAVQPT